MEKFVAIIKLGPSGPTKVYGPFTNHLAASDFLARKRPDPMSEYMAGWHGWAAPLLDPEAA